MRYPVAELCLSCSLCCTNGLFRSVPLRATEVAGLRARRLPLIKHDDEWLMPFPCAAHKGRCSIYSDRPSACREYECDVLVALNAGQMPASAARSLLDRTNALVASIRTRIAGTGEFWADVDRSCEDSAEWRSTHADLLLDLFELHALLRRVDRKNG
jgi:hypothetical protein